LLKVAFFAFCNNVWSFNAEARIVNFTQNILK